MQACIELGLIFKCDPYIFLNKTEDEVLRLYKVTQETIANNSD